MSLSRPAARVVGVALAIMAATTVLQARELKTEEEKLLYYFGVQIGMQIQTAGISDPKQVELIQAGLTEQIDGQAQDLGDLRPRLAMYLSERQEDMAAAELAASEAYLAEMAAEDGAVTTASGMVYQELTPGTGDQPTTTSRVKAHYRGTLRDGSVFDSSYGRGKPLEIGLNQVVPCWTEGIAMMQEGGKAKLTCPPALAYGERGQGRIPGNAALTFEVELIEVLD